MQVSLHGDNMKKIHTIQIADTNLMCTYVLSRPDGVVTVNGLRIFPGSQRTELTEVLSDNAKLLIGKQLAKSLKEEYNDIYFNEE